MNTIDFKDDFSKSEFDLTGESSNEISDLDGDSLGMSNLDLDDDLKLFKLKNNQAKKQQYEVKQLQHDLQLTRIDLAQREYQLNNLRIEHNSKCESLEEKCQDLTHQNQMLNARLNSLIAIHQEEDRQKQEQIKLELSRILVRQQELEENNSRFMKSEHEIKKEIRSIDTLNWTHEQYEFMARRDEDLLTIKEFTALKLYNTTRPLKTRLEDASKQILSLETQLESNREELTRIKKIYENEKQSFNINTADNQKLYYELADAKAMLQQANFKKDNFDRIKFERDDLERKLNESNARNSATEATMHVLTKERDDLIRKADQLVQEISLLRQDKDYLQKQFVDAQSRYRVAEDKLEQIQKLYEDAKRTKEELYEKHMSAREAYKSEYETRLTQELDELKIKTNQEIEKLRVNTKEFYEREIKNLREAKDLAIQDKERHELNQKELNVKYQEAVNELRIVQISCENKMAELKSELKLKYFELDRANMLNEENINMYQKSLTENEKLQKKIEIIQNEYYHVQVQNDKRILEIENELNEKKSRLESYEKVENEMDLIIRQVAESSETGNINETEAEKVLSSYGYGANIVLNSKRRIQQNVHLTKRILHLEQLNTALRVELNKERNNYKDIVDQLEVAKSVLDNSKQPHEYLVRTMQAKEIQLKKQKSTIDVMQKKIDELSSEREILLKKQNEMNNDIEKLLRHNEELFEIREELKKSGLTLFNRKVLNSSKNLENPSGSEFGFNEQPKPMMFTHKQNRTKEPTSPQQRYKLRKSPEMFNQKSVYTIEKN